MADGGFLEFLIGGWLGARDERRRASRPAAAPRPPSAVERGTVRLLRRIFARDPAGVEAAAAAAKTARRRRERLQRARASARRRALRKARGLAALVLVVAALLFALAVLGRVSEHGTAPTVTHRG